MLQSGQLRDEATIARAKDAIVRNADAQVKLIDDLLDLSRITSGKMRLDVRRVDIPQVLQAALDAVRPAAGRQDDSHSDRVRSGGRGRHRRSGPAAAGRLEPSDERRQVHAGRR